MKHKIFYLTVNLFLSTIVLLIFRNLNWIKFTNVPEFVEDQFANDLIIAGIIGFAAFLIGEMISLGFKVMIIITCGVGCLLYPIFGLAKGYLKILGAHLLLPNWFELDSNFLKFSIIAVVIGLAKIPLTNKETITIRRGNRSK